MSVVGGNRRSSDEAVVMIVPVAERDVFWLIGVRGYAFLFERAMWTAIALPCVHNCNTLLRRMWPAPQAAVEVVEVLALIAPLPPPLTPRTSWPRRRSCGWEIARMWLLQVRACAASEFNVNDHMRVRMVPLLWPHLR